MLEIYNKMQNFLNCLWKYDALFRIFRKFFWHTWVASKIAVLVINENCRSRPLISSSSANKQTIIIDVRYRSVQCHFTHLTIWRGCSYNFVLLFYTVVTLYSLSDHFVSNSYPLNANFHSFSVKKSIIQTSCHETTNNSLKH